MYDINFRSLLYGGIFLGVVFTLIAFGLWELLDWLFDVTIEFTAW